ncbi:ATP-dependent Clp protease ATP-binding subunit ClpX [Lentzea sp. NPDC054927]
MSDSAVVVYCTFCKKSQHEVVKVITGPDVAICNECVELCNEIIEEERGKDSPDSTTEVTAADLASKPPTPTTLFDQLSKIVIGQEEAKRDLAVAVYRHHLNIRSRGRGQPGFDKGNVLLIGPTGTGKTLLAKALADILRLPLAIVDATTYTEAGYVGDDVENMFKVLLKAAGGNKDLAANGIIYIDEIDKIGRKSANPSITRDVSGEGVQQALLNILDGGDVTYDPTGNRKNPGRSHVEFATDRILFICGGSFEGLPQVIARRLSRTGTVRRQLSSHDLVTEVTQADLVDLGFMPEFASRFTTLSVLSPLNHSQLISLLRETPQSPIRQYTSLLAEQGCDLIVTDEALEALAHIALEEQAGARGVSRVVDRMMRDVLFALPDNQKIRTCTVDEKVVRGTKPPQLTDAKNRPIVLQRDRVFISYSRLDTQWLDELTTTLNPLMRKNVVNVWFDKEIKPSQVWRDEIAHAMASTSVAVLLVSANFLKSDFINSEELPYFLEAAASREVTILWVLLSDCLYTETPLVNYQAVHDIAQPMATLPKAKRQTTWTRICQEIKRATTG